jgi:WD40 repeat protein
MEDPRMVAFSPDGKRVATAVAISSTSGLVSIRDAGTGILIRNLPERTPTDRGAANFVAQVIGARAVGPAGGPCGALLPTLAAVSALQLNVFSRGAAPCDVVAWAPDGKLIASGGQDRAVRLWDASTGALVRTLGGHARTITALSFSRDGKRLASASGGITRRFPAMSPNPLKLPSDEKGEVPDVKVWDVATGKELRSFSFAGKGPGMALSPDGETVAVTFGAAGATIREEFVLGAGGFQGRTWIHWGAEPRPNMVRLYSVATGEEVAVLRGHTRPPWCVAFSPDGKRVVTGGADETIKLWDPRTGEEIMTVGRHPNIVTSVSFSPDGHKIVSTSDDRDVRVWDATPLKK